MNRENIYVALFNVVDTAARGAGAVTISRKLLHWTDVPPVNQPAVFQIQRTESFQQARGVPAKWTLLVDLYVYVNTAEDPQVAPTTKLNPILDALESAFLPCEPDGPVTLGGLVSHAWISGPIETFEGLLGEQEVAIIPIEIVGTE
jgi:hypothetical protein